MSEGFAPETYDRLRADAEAIVARYPENPRSALGPMLHLVQSEEGYVSPRGIALCSDVLDITRSEVSAVATFYSQYRRHPNGEYNVGVCTNPVCGVMGGDLIWDAVTDKLGIDHDQTTADGKITLERLECNAACDYAPVVMINWEFFDNQTPDDVLALIDDLQAGRDVHPTRGADKVHTFKEISRVLAGFEDGHVDEGPSAGEASLRGRRIAAENEWHAPHEDGQQPRAWTAPVPTTRSGSTRLGAEGGPTSGVAPDASALGRDVDPRGSVPETGERGSSAQREETTPADVDPETIETHDVEREEESK